MAKLLILEDLYTEESVENGMKNFISCHFLVYNLNASEAGIFEKGSYLLWDRMSPEDKISYFKKNIPLKYLFSDEYVFVNGKIKGYTKDELAQKTLKIGYMAKSFTKSTTLMVIADEADEAKLSKAEELGIPMLSQEDFLKIINS